MMKNIFNVLAIKQLEGGTYIVDTVLKVIKQITDWALAIGMSLAGVALVISFIMPNFLVVPSYACNLKCIYCYEQTYIINGTTDIDPLEMVDLQFDRIDKIMNIYEEKYTNTAEILKN